MYAYPVHSSVPAPPHRSPSQLEIGRQWLPRLGAEDPPHCDRHGGACPERRCSCGRRNSGGSRRQSAALSGRPPAVRLTAIAQKRGHHRSDGPFWGSMSVFIRRLAAPAGFPLPHAATGLPVRLPPYKVWERPLPRSRSRGVSPIHISSQNDFFPLHSICMEKSAYHSPCRCGMGCAGRHSPCLRQITKRGGLWIHKTKKLYLHGYSKQTL